MTTPVQKGATELLWMRMDSFFFCFCFCFASASAFASAFAFCFAFASALAFAHFCFGFSKRFCTCSCLLLLAKRLEVQVLLQVAYCVLAAKSLCRCIPFVTFCELLEGKWKIPTMHGFCEAPERKSRGKRVTWCFNVARRRVVNHKCPQSAIDWCSIACFETGFHKKV